MIRPDFSLFDSAMRSSPAKASAAMHAHYRGGSSGVAGGSIGSPGPSESRSCPRTPTSVKKRKDSSNAAAAAALALANPHSTAYRRELERKLLDGDYLIFHRRDEQITALFPTSTTTRTAAQIAPADAAVESVDSHAPSDAHATVTLGSLLGVSSLLLSSSNPRDFLFSPGPSPQPSPALCAFTPPPRSPLAIHPIGLLTQSHAAHPLAQAHAAGVPTMLLDGDSPPSSPTPEQEGGVQKRALTTQQWATQQATNAAGPLAATTTAVPSQSPATAMGPSSFLQRRGDGSVSADSSCGSADNASVISSNRTSRSCSTRGSFSNLSAAGSGILSADTLAAHAASFAAPPETPSLLASLSASTPFTLHTRRRNNSGPASLVRSTRDAAAARERSGMPEPGGPVAAFNIFGMARAHHTMPAPQIAHAMVHSQQPEEAFSVHAPVPMRTPPPSHTPHVVHTPPHHSSLPPQHHTPLLTHHALLPLPGPPPPPAMPSSLPAPPMRANQFEWVHVIGRGSFGEVWKVSRKAPPGDANSPTHLFAIKKNLSPLSSIGERRAFLRRTELLKQICDGYNARLPSPFMPSVHAMAASHLFTAYRWPPHLLRHFVVWQESSLLYTMTEFCALGDLFQFFRHAARMAEQREKSEAARLEQERSERHAHGSDDEDMGVESSTAASSSLQRSSSTPALAPIFYTAPETKDLTERDLLHLLYQVASGLAVLHRQNILHSDVKPDNIYVCRRSDCDATDRESIFAHPSDAAYPFVFKLGDLGSLVSMSEWVDGGSEGDGSYLAPEVLNPSLARGANTTPSHPTARAAPANISAKIDIYALGVSIFTLVTGEKFVSTALQQDVAAAQPAANATMHDGSIMRATPTLIGARVPRPSILDAMSDNEPVESTSPCTRSSPASDMHSPQMRGATLDTIASTSVSLSSSQESLASIRALAVPSPESYSLGFCPTPTMSPLIRSHSQPHSAQADCDRLDNEVCFDASRDVLPVSSQLQDLVRRMVSVTPHVRPTAEELREWAANQIRQQRQAQAHT